MPTEPKRARNKQPKPTRQVDGVNTDAEATKLEPSLEIAVVNASSVDMISERMKALREARKLNNKERIQALISQTIEMFFH